MRFAFTSLVCFTVAQYTNRLEDNITNVFGAKFLSTLMAIEVPLVEERNTDEQDRMDDDTSASGKENKSTSQDVKKVERKIWGMVSRAGTGVGRADNDRQFIYLNGRPVDLPKVTIDVPLKAIDFLASDRAYVNCISCPNQRVFPEYVWQGSEPNK